MQGKIVLASTSPRRKELLARIMSVFESVPPSYEEDMNMSLFPDELAGF